VLVEPCDSDGWTRDTILRTAGRVFVMCIKLAPTEYRTMAHQWKARVCELSCVSECVHVSVHAELDAEENQ
jgi:hypothetical protein